MKHYIIFALVLVAAPTFSQGRDIDLGRDNEQKRRNEEKTDAPAQAVDTPKTKTDSIVVAADTVSAKTDSVAKTTTTAKTDSVAKTAVTTTTAATTTKAVTNTANLDSLAHLNSLLTAKFNTVNAELEKYKVVYTVIKEKVLKRDFDPEKFAQVVDSLAANRDSTAMGFAAMSTALRDSLINFKKEITGLKAKVEAANTEEAAKQRLVNELKTLKELLDSKILTQTEFDIKKAAVLRKWDWFQTSEGITKIRGTVTSENDGDPLSNVKFMVYEKGTTNIVKHVITDAEGKYNAAQLTPGDYDFKWELSGYRTVTENNVHITAGKEVKRNLVMEQGGGSAVLEADVPATSIANVPVNGLDIIEQSTMRLEVTGSTLRFYPSASNVGAPGAQYFDVAPGQIFTKTVLEWANVFGFDEDIEDFLNVQNTGATPGHYKMKWENLGA